MTERSNCPRLHPGHLMHHAQERTVWRQEPNGDRTCSGCGSWHPAEFLAWLQDKENGPLNDDDQVRVELSDKRYKVYARQKSVKNAGEGAIKCYAQHMEAEGLLDEINEALVPAVAKSREKGERAFRALHRGLP